MNRNQKMAKPSYVKCYARPYARSAAKQDSSLNIFNGGLLLFIISLFIVLISASFLKAETTSLRSVVKPKDNREYINLTVRTINAVYLEKLSSKDIDPRLKDLESKLQNLPYNKFTLRSSEIVAVPTKRKTTLRLPGGHSLSVRVLYRNEKRLGLFLDWIDEMGMMVLNSKAHLNCREPFLAGTDNVKGGGLLLTVAAE